MALASAFFFFLRETKGKTPIESKTLNSYSKWDLIKIWVSLKKTKNIQTDFKNISFGKEKNNIHRENDNK